MTCELDYVIPYTLTFFSPLFEKVDGNTSSTNSVVQTFFFFFSPSLHPTTTTPPGVLCSRSRVGKGSRNSLNIKSCNKEISKVTPQHVKPALPFKKVHSNPLPSVLRSLVSSPSGVEVWPLTQGLQGAAERE